MPIEDQAKILVYTEINEVQDNDGNDLQLPVGKIVELSTGTKNLAFCSWLPMPYPF